MTTLNQITSYIASNIKFLVADKPAEGETREGHPVMLELDKIGRGLYIAFTGQFSPDGNVLYVNDKVNGTRLFKVAPLTIGGLNPTTVAAVYVSSNGTDWTVWVGNNAIADKITMAFRIHRNEIIEVTFPDDTMMTVEQATKIILERADWEAENQSLGYREAQKLRSMGFRDINGAQIAPRQKARRSSNYRGLASNRRPF